jgi:hypothetical protein
MEGVTVIGDGASVEIERKPCDSYVYSIAIGDGAKATKSFEVVGADFDEGWLRQHTIDTLNDHVRRNPEDRFEGKLEEAKQGISHLVEIHREKNTTDTKQLAIDTLQRVLRVFDTI